MNDNEKLNDQALIYRDTWIAFMHNIKKIFMLNSVIVIMTIFYSLNLVNVYQSKAVYLLKEDIQFSAQQDLSGLVPFNLGSKDSYHMNYIKSVLKSRDFFKTLYINEDFIIHSQASSGYDYSTREVILDKSLVNPTKKEWLTIDGVSTKPIFEKSYKEFNENFSSSIDLGEGKIVLSFKHYSPYYSREALSLINDNFNSYIKNIKSLGVNERKDFLNNEFNKASISYIKNNLSQLMLNEIEKQVFYSTSGNIFFDTIDKPSIGIRFAPKRSLIVIYSSVLGFIFSSLLFVVIDLIRTSKTKVKV